MALTVSCKFEASHIFQKLSDEATFHEFCRLLARLKANYQLGELVKARNYPECIALIADFTAASLRMWRFSPNSIHYLLSLWQVFCMFCVEYIESATLNFFLLFVTATSNCVANQVLFIDLTL